MLDKSEENAYNKDNKTKERKQKQGGRSNENIAPQTISSHSTSVIRKAKGRAKKTEGMRSNKRI